MNKILIIVGGAVEKIEKFQNEAEKMGIDVTLASFADLNYASFGKEKGRLFVGKQDVAVFDTLYIRMVGKRLEDASLLAGYAKKHGIRIVDNLYSKELLLPSSIAKSVETQKLIDAGILIPKTIYGSVSLILTKGRREFGYPYVVKSTSGRKARDAWLIDSAEKEKELISILREKERLGMRFFGQEFIPARQRERVFVIGGKAVAGITRPTKWRKKITGGSAVQNPEGIKAQIKPIPIEYINLAEKATKAVDLDIAGVDILRDETTGRLLVIEVNAAPSWKLITKDCGLNVEAEILKFLNRGADVLLKTKKFYQDKFKKYGVDPKSLLWKQKGAAHQRFRQFWQEIDFNGKSVLDVGCGFGEFGKFLTKRYKDVKYTGVDIVPEFIEEGKKLYPHLDLKVGDFLIEDFGQYDVVIASGVLNSNVENNLEYRKQAIARLFGFAKKILAFNMLGGHPQPENDPESNVWYADSLEILAYCQSLTRRIILRANYHPRDFTILMQRVSRKV